MHTVTTALGTLAIVGALVAGCDATVGIGGTPAVGKDALQTDIANRLANAGETPQSVRCEEDLVGAVGATARCEVDAGGLKLRRTVEVNNVEGLMMNFDVVPVLTKEKWRFRCSTSFKGNPDNGPSLRSAKATSRARRETLWSAPSLPGRTPRRTRLRSPP